MCARALLNHAREPLEWAALEALDVRLSRVSCAWWLSPRALVPRAFYKRALSASEFRLAYFLVHCTELCRLTLSLFCLCSHSPLISSHLCSALLSALHSSRFCIRLRLSLVVHDSPIIPNYRKYNLWYLRLSWKKVLFEK